MKKAVSLILAVLLLLSLFAGCGGETQQPNGSSATQAPSSGGSTATQAPAEPASPYNYAAGKYEKNADGYPVAKYVYEEPICTNDEVLTKWTTCYTPQYIPEDGWGSIPTWKGVRDYTGVHIEYNVVDSANRSQNFSVLLASDDLDHIVDQGAFFYQGGTVKAAIEDGYFVNLIGYRDYMPNFMWEVYTRSRANPDVLSTVYYDSETIATMSGMLVEPAPGMGYFVRQDWMTKLGYGKAEDIHTYDQLHELLVATKVAYSTPEKEIFTFFINNNVENAPGAFFGGYDTSIYTTGMSYMRVRDGKVEFCGTTEDDRQAMTMLNQWFSEGLISPNFQTFVAGGDYESGSTTDALFCNLMPPSSWQNTEDSGPDPDTDWEPIPRTLRTESQILKYGNKASNFHYGSANITGNCPNVELAVSWLDWWMSDFGSEWTSWGPEGYLWEYNDKGQRRLTDWCMNHEASMAWIMCLYGCNGLVEFCLQIHKRNYAYEGGDRALTAFDVFTPSNYNGEYEWPSSAKLNDEEREETTQLFTDLNTYYEENYVAFVDGSKPMSEWESYIADVKSFGYDRIQELYQQAYDRYMASL